MGASRSLRRISDSVVVAVPAGVRIRTRIYPTQVEATALETIGSFLGSVYRAELAGRVRLGRLDRRSHGMWRAERKRAVTAVTSSRWGGAITRAVEDQYQFSMRSLTAHVTDLTQAVEVLEQRCALRPGEVAGGRGRHRRGYRSARERFAKTRRLAVLRSRLITAESALAAGHPSISVGGNRLWSARNHLDEVGLTQDEWRARWVAARMFLTADGESGKPGGNATIRVDEIGRLHVKVPAALVARLGPHVYLGCPVAFSYRGTEWAQRLAERRAVRYDITYDAAKDRWYLDASWRCNVATTSPSIDELRVGPVLGVDLNADHLACCVLDSSGNAIGNPMTIRLQIAGLPASQRDGRVREAISALLEAADHSQCRAVVIEDLNFADNRATGRDTMGSGRRGKRFRATVAGIPTARFRSRLTSMANRRGIAIIAVDPAYTSVWGAKHWQEPLQQQTSDRVTRHHGAAAAIGRRGLGLTIRRRPAGPRNGQRTIAGTPLTRPEHQSNRVGRYGSSGPPLRTRDAHRSTGEHPPPAANTVWAAPEPHSLLLTHYNH